MSEPKLLLNLGCGLSFHPDWENLDLVPQAPQVKKADLSTGIPYADGSADAVYHSHMLEHLTRDAATVFVKDCLRVLKPGGVLRIAVPDLEQIARVYLQATEEAWNHPTDVQLANHRWMQLELLDQLIRNTSGGQMGIVMTDPELPNQSFVRQRLGYEVENADSVQKVNPPKPSWVTRTMGKWKRRLIRLFFGKPFLRQMDTIAFRDSGEIHQWMYDRVSLREMLLEAGFDNFRICTAWESDISNFSSFQLDTHGQETKKPDSIFVEASKPKKAVRNAA